MSVPNAGQIFFICYHCGYKSKKKFNIKRHIETLHSDGNTKPKSLPGHKCSLCDLYCAPRREDVYDHYSQVHEINVVTSDLHFDNWDDFISWKNDQEKAEVCNYTIAYRRSKVNIDTLYYRCHRDGYYKPKGKGVRRLKVKGTNRINGLCPASVTAKKHENGHVDVKYISTHVGHEREVDRLRLSREERAEIAEKISQKVPLDSILNKIRTSFTPERVERIHLCSKRDLMNIARDFNIEKAKKNKEDISFDSWIVELQQTTSWVRFFKPPLVPSCRVELRDDDFFVVLANDEQIKMLRSQGENFICIDTIQCCNYHNIQVTLILTKDETGRCYPCAFLISNRIDQDTMTVFFTIVQETLGHDLGTDVFMSEPAQFFYIAWRNIFRTPKMRVYSPWRVDALWRKNLALVIRPESRSYVYHLIRELAFEKDEIAFQRQLTSSLAELITNSETAEFGRYFQKEFAGCPHYWALCYIDARVTRSVHLETMHKRIEHICFKGKFARRLAGALNELMKHVRDKLFPPFVCPSEVGKTQKKIANLRDRHEKSLKLPTLIRAREDDCWELVGETDMDYYTVQKAPPTRECSIGSRGCEVLCCECYVCAHTFVCSCADHCVKSNMCVHIHIIARHLSGCEPPPRPNFVILPLTNPLSETPPKRTLETLVAEMVAESDHDDHNMDIVYEDSKPPTIIVTDGTVITSTVTIDAAVSTDDDPIRLESRKQRVEGLFHEVSSLCSSVEDYDDVIRALLPVVTALRTKNTPAATFQPVTPQFTDNHYFPF
ncbi:unnamed protein product [Nesidiocoris tenuis]|uniref:C2H2-type domain-containing protein n=1 Tax=Nesidiocoris tenuis TaxID=355587 RepID=A0A6H5G9Y5_9HEMI|nr:unnamed protein product [Nesidiocoris tenuis]